MATRSLVVLEDEYGAVVLYKHYDGYPEFMLLFLEEFAKWYAKKVERSTGYFPHFLWQADDVAAALIYFDYIEAIKMWKRLGRSEPPRPSPDVRPTNLQKREALSRENCMDEDYVYHVVLQRDLTWKVTVYEKRGGLSEKEVREIDLASFVSEETLKKYPEFVRPESPRVRAAVKKMRQDAQS